MLRTFTYTELQTLTNGAYQALPAEDKAAFDAALVRMWVETSNIMDTAELSRDLDLVDASHRRGDLGA